MDASSAFKDSLPTSPEAVMAVLENLDISFSTHHHPPLRTVEDSKQFRDGMDGAHIKNLYMRDRKKKNFLVVADEDRAIDMKTLNGRIGCDRLSFGSADRLFEMLGVRPGAVSPLTLINDPDQRVRLVIDAKILRSGMIYVHPLVNDMTLGITADGLQRFFQHCGHDPLMLDFDS
jgi:Ala-tRNA(Pro) deacylase